MRIMPVWIIGKSKFLSNVPFIIEKPEQCPIFFVKNTPDGQRTKFLETAELTAFIYSCLRLTDLTRTTVKQSTCTLYFYVYIVIYVSSFVRFFSCLRYWYSLVSILTTIWMSFRVKLRVLEFVKRAILKYLVPPFASVCFIFSLFRPDFLPLSNVLTRQKTLVMGWVCEKRIFFFVTLIFTIVRPRYEFSPMSNIPIRSFRRQDAADLQSLFLLYATFLLNDISLLVFHPIALKIVFLSISLHSLYVFRDYSIIILLCWTIRRTNDV